MSDPLSMSTILIVDDIVENIQILGQTLEDDYEIRFATNGPDALEIAFSEDTIDLVLLDVMMPNMDGYEVCRRLKEDSRTEDIPVVFLTARDKLDDVVTGFDNGAVDYIIKPFNSRELSVRVRTHLELKKARERLKENNERLAKANEEILKKNKELKEAEQRLERAVRTDPLTGLSNRRDMQEKLKYEEKRFLRNKKSFALIMCDIDDFKHFNDSYGHDVGDFVLTTAADTMRSSLRSQDMLSRWGGEEFLMLLPETGMQGAVITAEKVRAAIAGSTYTHKDLKLNITLTLGVSVFDDPEMDMDEAINRADSAMYFGKQNGKNRVATHDMVE